MVDANGVWGEFVPVLIPAAGAPAGALRSGDVPDYDYDPDEDEDDGGIFDLKKLQVCYTWGGGWRGGTCTSNGTLSYGKGVDAGVGRGQCRVTCRLSLHRQLVSQTCLPRA